MRATAYIGPNRTPSEKTLLQLVRCPFPALRKSAFLLLKSIYEHKYVPREVPNSYRVGLKVELKSEEITNELVRDASSYFYAWQLLLMRR